MPASQYGAFCAVCAHLTAGMPNPAPIGKPAGLPATNIAWDRAEVLGRDGERGEPQGPSLFAESTSSKLGSVPSGEPLSLSLPRPAHSEVLREASVRSVVRELVLLVRSLESLSTDLLELAEGRPHPERVGLSPLRDRRELRRVSNVSPPPRAGFTPKSGEDVS